MLVRACSKKNFRFSLDLKIAFERHSPVNHQHRQTEDDAVNDLLWVTLCEGQFSCHMKHDFSPVKGSVDRFTSCLTMTHIQSSPKAETKGDERSNHVISHISCVISPHCQHTLPCESLQLNRLSQNRQELFKLLAFLIVTQYILLSELQGNGFLMCCHI